jgi:uncharacterized SAM-binding protein YcdF (DUF218 family)
MRIDEPVRGLVETLWNYHRLGHQLSKADAILVLCSHDTTVAERAAQLFLDGWAPLLIFSGGRGSITARLWTEPEADHFARIAMGLGVPARQILIENQSTNTGVKILFTRRLLDERRLAPDRLILVQKPYMERRSYATFKRLWPDKELIVTSPQVSFDEYFANRSAEVPSTAEVINILVGDLHRIRVYPEKGFQIPQEIPEAVWSAFECLVAAGYDTRLVE